MNPEDLLHEDLDTAPPFRVFAGPEKLDDVLPDRSNLVELFGARVFRTDQEHGRPGHATFDDLVGDHLREAWASYLPKSGKFGFLVTASRSRWSGGEPVEFYIEGCRPTENRLLSDRTAYDFDRARTPEKGS